MPPIITKTYTGPTPGGGPARDPAGSLPHAAPLGDDECLNVVATDDVDRSREVVVPSGGEFADFLRNPVVTYNHSDDHDDSFLLPVGRSVQLALSPDGRQLLSRTQFDAGDEFAKRVGGQVKRGFLNSWSVKFIPLESGPPTAAELRARPDWARAKTIFRRWKLVAFSPVILPDNPYAVTVAKALALAPTPPESKAMADDESKNPFAAGDHVRCHKSMGGGCGVVKALHNEGTHLGADDKALDADHDEPVVEIEKHDGDCKPTGVMKKYRAKDLKPFGGEAEPDGDEEPDGDKAEGEPAAKGLGGAGGDPEPEPEPTPESKSLGMVETVGGSGGYAARGEPDGDEPEIEPEIRTPRAGHYVKFDNGKVRGVGKLVSVHKGEMVPDVDDDILGTDEDPGVRVQVHKAVADGHRPTDLHVGCRLSQTTKSDALRPPAAKPKAAPPFAPAASKLAAPTPAPPRVLKFTPVSPAELLHRQREWLETPEGAAAVARAVGELGEKRSGAI